LRRDGLPDVLERRRIACEPKSGRFLYHAAAELAFESREKSIATGRREARAAAVRELKSLVESLKGKSVFVAAAAVPGGNTKLPDKLADILAAHSRIHAAEGCLLSGDGRGRLRRHWSGCAAAARTRTLEHGIPAVEARG
jgi:hypothetical protein